MKGLNSGASATECAGYHRNRREKMTFESIERALGYLSGQNPGKVAIVVPKKEHDSIVAYELQFHDPGELMVRAISHAPSRVICLKKIPSDDWELEIA